MTTYTLEQQKEHRKLWVEALRSGKYRQCKDALRCKTKDGNRYCCLGVLTKLSGLRWNKEGFADDCYAVAPQKAKDFVGLADCIGGFQDEALAKLNDAGKTFAEIADIIESEPPGLFVESVQP